MKNNIRGNTVVFLWSSWKKTQGVTLMSLSNKILGVTLSFFIGRHEKNIRGNTVDIYPLKHMG